MVIPITDTGEIADTIENLLRRLSVPDGEIAPLVTQMGTDGWKSYQVAAKELGVLLLPESGFRKFYRSTIPDELYRDHLARPLLFNCSTIQK